MTRGSRRGHGLAWGQTYSYHPMASRLRAVCRPASSCGPTVTSAASLPGPRVVPPAPQASVSPSAKWDDAIPLLILELSGGSSRTLAQEIREAIKGRGSANPRPLLAPLPRSPLDFREGSFLESPCHVPHSTESQGHSPDVVAVHVLLRAPMDDPVGQLPPTAAAQHHSWQGWSQRSAEAPEPSPQPASPLP